MKCKYCNNSFTCGCQKITASDGAVVHKSCLSSYNKLQKNPAYDSFTTQIMTATNNLKGNG